MTVWQLSVRSLPVILSIVIVRALALHRIPKRTFLVLWGLALFALLVPVQLHLPLPSILMPAGEPAVPATYDFPDAQNGIVKTRTGLAISDGGHVPLSSDTELAVISWTRIIWMLVAGSMAVYFVVNHIRYRLRYRFAVPCENETVKAWLQRDAIKRRKVKIKVSADISTALTYGLFRPVILLPKATDWEDATSLEYVMLHEMTHIRHYDTIWKRCLCMALCVHWFNPLVWVMFILANRDLEVICDESVIRTIGASSKSAYALALIGFAEKQIKITQFGMAFSKNAIEERILAIMKTKKVSWLGAVLAVALIASVTTGFTATWQVAAADSSSQTANDDLPNVAQVTEERFITAYTDPQNGTTSYSWDGGRTWTTMSDEEFVAAQKIPGVEWWTAEEYAQWLEQEKLDLQACVGDKGWTPSTGWFTWDQQMVDETIARYEQTLKDIQNGLRISKPTANGDTMTMVSYDPEVKQSYSDTTMGSGTFIGFNENGQMQSARIPSRERLEEYKAFGLVYDKENQLFFWNGALVRYFSDEYEYGGGIATLYSYANGNGVVDLRAVRQAAQNADGETYPIGKLVAIEEYSQEEFDNRIVIP